MPMMKEDRIKDLCYDCGTEGQGNPPKKKCFRLTAIQMRAAEAAAVKFTSEMAHKPMESIIIDHYKRLKNTGADSQKQFVKHMGEKAFKEMCSDYMRKAEESVPAPPSDSERDRICEQVHIDVGTLLSRAQQLMGEARLTTASKGADFLRMLEVEGRPYWF